MLLHSEWLYKDNNKHDTNFNMGQEKKHVGEDDDGMYTWILMFNKTITDRHLW